MTAMSTCFAGPKGEITDRMIEYYATRAAGGVALITVEEAYIHPYLQNIKNALGIYSDNLIPSLRSLTRRIHEAEAKVSLQIGLHFSQQFNGFPQYTVSRQAPNCGPDAKELNRDEIHYLTHLFVDAADRAQRAEFDAVEIHACHGCTLSEFLSPFWNKRTDEYGGDQAGRFRFAKEILEGIRQRLGLDFAVFFRISGSEFVQEGFTPEDAVALSKVLEEGGVTAINVSGGLGHLNHIAIPPGDIPRGLLLPIGKRIRKAVKVPIIMGNSMTPSLAQKAVETGATDLVGLGRPLIADPEWPQKVEQGRLDEIRHCLRCNQGCFWGLMDDRRQRICCMYNPLAGREFECAITKAGTKRCVVVVGGGPAGCEVARVLRLRGHDVILLEKTDRLGGQFNLASVAPKKEGFKKLVDFYTGELRRLGVDVRLETEATSNLLDALDVDMQVFATGSAPVRPAIPGANLPHVITTYEVLSGNVEVNESSVIIIGGGATGLETADFLSEKGIKVTVIEMLDSPGRDILEGIGIREALLARLAAKDVTILSGHRVMAIMEDAVVVSNRPLVGGGKERQIAAKKVVLSIGLKPQNILEESMGVGKPIRYRIGDCQSPGNAFDAIQQAFELAIKI